MPLSNHELEKYQRHFLIGGFTKESQEKIMNARVLVIGAGGLGSPVIMYLAGAGTGTIGLVEYDTVSVSNLPRQILFTHEDIGKSKALLAQEKILAMNPDCRVIVHEQKWEDEKAETIASGFDLLIDCTDNLESRYLTDAVSRKLKIPFVYGAVHQMEGQLAVFNYKGSKGYTEFFTNKKLQPIDTPQGVLGPIAGTIGNLQAAEALKIITGIGEVLVNKMLFISLRYNRYQLFQF